MTVEPVDGMRRVIEARLPGVRALAGTAEEILLPDAAVDAAFVAEAFHCDGIVAMVASWSSVGSLPDERRTAALAAVRDVLERHGIGETTIRFKAMITSAERVDG